MRNAYSPNHPTRAPRRAFRHPELGRALKVAIMAGLMVLGASTAPAAEKDAEVALAQQSETHLLYTAYWGGLHVADFSLSSIHNARSFENRFRLETRGLTRLFSNFSATASSNGKRISAPPSNGPSAAPSADRYLPSRYRADYRSSKHQRWVTIGFPPGNRPAYASTGTRPIAGKEANWNPKDKGPEVLEKVVATMRIGVLDPISAINQLQAGIKAHLEGGPANFTLKGFDGRRRFDLDVQYLGPATRIVFERPFDTYHVRVMPRPVAGFKKRHKILWKDSAFDFYLSRDGRFTPIQIVPQKHGPVLSLLRTCRRPCELPKEEN